MKKLRIGLVDLDTSHPAAFVPILRSGGHEIAGVFDGGEINPEGYAAAFAAEHGVGQVYESLADMAEAVDLAFVHSCNWDRHIERMRPFVEAGKAVFVDKPLAGNVRDLRQMMAWEERGARIAGGSALRYCREVEEWLALGISPDDWVYATAGCGVDEFNYGIHAFTMLHSLGGAGIAEIRCLGASGQKQYELLWKDGRRGMVGVGGTKGYLPFYAGIVTQSRYDSLLVDSSRLYASMLEAVLPYLAGDAPAPVSLRDAAEAELSAIAARLSLESQRPVALQDIPEDYAPYDGAAFASKYRLLKYPAAERK